MRLIADVILKTFSVSVCVSAPDRGSKNLNNWGRLGSKSVSVSLRGLLSSPLFIIHWFGKSRGVFSGLDSALCYISRLEQQSTESVLGVCFAWRCICMAPLCILMTFDCELYCTQSGPSLSSDFITVSVYFCAWAFFYLTSNLTCTHPLSWVSSSVLSCMCLQML